MTRNHNLKFNCLMEWLAGKNKAIRTSRGWALLTTKYDEMDK